MKLNGYEELFRLLQRQAVNIEAELREDVAHKKEPNNEDLEVQKFLGNLNIEVCKAKAQAEAHGQMMCLLNIILNTLVEIRNK